MHVPAGDEIGVLPVEQVNLHQRVLEDAVEEGSHVEVAVGVRRAVVQDVRRVLAVPFESLAIGVVLAPPLHRAGSRLGSSPRIGKSVFGRFRVER